MAALSSIFWIFGFALSVLIAPQLPIWIWGPTMLCFAVSTVVAIPLIWKERSIGIDTFLVASASALALWIGIRAAISPVPELAKSDFLLTAMAVATFASFRASSGNRTARNILIYGLTVLLAASVWVIGKQVGDPMFSPIFPISKPRLPAGFYAHYSYGASFLVPVSMILAAFALHSKLSWPARIGIGLVAVSGMVAVYFTHSRGGFVGLGAGLAVLALLTVLVGNQQGKKWFPPAIIILPFILILLAILSFKWLTNIQEARVGTGELMGMLDNEIRLILMGIAVSCIGLHPIFGGGSRSFSWECFKFWDVEAMGPGVAKPEHVHNELLQTATDYGLLGVSLLLFFVVAAVIVAAFRITARNSVLPSPFENSWRIGGLAGFAGLFAHSNFEGIFRIPPGAILLGICFAAMCLPAQRRDSPSRTWLSPILISIGCIVAFAPLLAYGWKGTQALRNLWPVTFSKVKPGNETSADALSRAIAHLPMGTLYQIRGENYHRISDGIEPDQDTKVDSEYFLGLALKDYREAERLHPFDPSSATITALILSELGQYTEAESKFQKAIELQGGMEASFHCNALFADYYLKKGLKKYTSGDRTEAHASFQRAAAQAEKTVENYGEGAIDQYLRVGIHESYGMTLEEKGEFRKALEQFDFAAALPGGSSGNFHAGALLCKRGIHAWSQRRSSDAMRLFMDSQIRFQKAVGLPPTIEEKEKRKYLDYLENTIGLLQDADINPSDQVDL